MAANPLAGPSLTVAEQRVAPEPAQLHSLVRSSLIARAR